MSALEHLRIHKDPFEVELALAGAAPRRVQLFLAEHGSHDFNRQRVLELVDPAGSFLPVRDLETGEWESLNSRAVVWIGISGASIEAEGSGDELFEHRRSVRVALAPGGWLEGEILYLAADGGPRLVDIDQFPADRQDQIRQMLSTSLRGVIAQTLCRKIGGGRVAAYEILYATPAVANLIRESKTFQIYSVIQTNRGAGMMTLNDSLLDLVKRKLVDPKEASLHTVNKSEFAGMLTKEGFPVSAPER